MNFQTLSLYCEVIRSGSFSLGAAAHHISQSAASQAVRQLEVELGATLIDRTKRPFMVTPEGRRFFDACQQLIIALEIATSPDELTDARSAIEAFEHGGWGMFAAKLRPALAAAEARVK